MKFSCERDILIKEISIAQEIISSRNTLSILSNVYLKTEDDNLTVKATDLKVSFETSIPVKTEDPGTTTVFCDRFLSILRALPPGEVEFEMEDSLMLTIRPLFKKIDFHLKSIHPEKYPEIQEAVQENSFEFPQRDIKDMIAATIFAISNDEARYFMNGVYLEKVDDKLIMVASDGRRLSHIGKAIDPDLADIKGIIIPPKILNILRKLLPGEGNLSIGITDKYVFFCYGNYRLSSSLIEGQFPNYHRVIPEQQERKLIVQKDLLENALKRVSLLVEQKSRRIYLRISENNLTVSSEESEIGTAAEEIPCEYTGPEDTIALNYIYLTEPLREMKEDTVSLEFTETNKAVTMKPVPETDYLHVVMPMQAK